MSKNNNKIVIIVEDDSNDNFGEIEVTSFSSNEIVGISEQCIYDGEVQIETSQIDKEKTRISIDGGNTFISATDLKLILSILT